MKKIILFCIEICLLLIVVIGIGINFFVIDDGAITNKYLFYQISTGSMASDETNYEISTIEIKDIIVVQRNLEEEFYENLKIGDVITFEMDEENSVITHRIIEIIQIENGYSITTKGDANYHSETLNTIDNKIYGKVVLSSPTLGRLFDNAYNNYFLIVLISVPCLIIIIYEINIIKKIVLKK